MTTLERDLLDLFHRYGFVDYETLARQALDAAEQSKRDARVYMLRGRMTEIEVAEVMNLSPTSIRRIVRIQREARKKR